MSFHKIVSLEVDDGFLKDLKLDFAEHLNCVIGSRGSGKTTLLEFLRFVLNQPPNEPPRGSFKKLLDKNLKPGRIRVVVEDASGKRYIIDRFAHEPPKVFDEASGRALVGGWNSVFHADVFTQAEIAQIAEEPAEQQSLLDGFAVEELADLSAKRQTTERQLEQLALSLGKEAEQAAEFHDVKSQLDSNAKRLEELKPPASELSKAKDQAIAAQVLRKKEAQELAAAAEHLLWAQEELARVGNEVTTKLTSPISSESLSGPNAGLLRPVAGELQALMLHVRASVIALSERLRAQRTATKAVVAQLEEIHLVQDAAADEVLKQDGEARERLELEKQQAELKVKHARQVALAASREEKLKARQALVDELAAFVDQRTGVRQRECAKLNAELERDFGVKLQLRPGDDTSKYHERLDGILRGSGKHGQKGIIQKLLKLEPRSLVRLVLSGKKQALARDSGLSEDVATWVMTRLQEHSDLLELQATTNDDVVQIQFNVNGIWKPTQNLSTGQKCSAVLPVLMLQNARPLVADEPEGHLDQKTLVERLVKQIHEMKGSRQLILATHNPNIVTLGDAGDTSVVVLSCDGVSATATQGTVDEMRQEIEELLEGGKEAFRKRGELYAR